MAQPHDTDLIRDLRKLREELAERCVPNQDGCLIYPAGALMVRLQGYRELCGMSPARVAWALANPHSHLGVNDYAVHICEFQWAKSDTQCCCNPDHLRKGTRADVEIMIRARARRLILQGGS